MIVDPLAEELVHELERLFSVFGERDIRLVIRPSWCTLESVDGIRPIELNWSEDVHHALIAALGELSFRGPSGHIVSALSGQLVVRRAHRGNRTISHLQEEGVLSGLACRFLDACLGEGKNILLVGPFAPAWLIGTHLLASGQRPAVVAENLEPVPPAWGMLKNAEDVNRFGADRIGIFSGGAPKLVDTMTSCSNVVGWLNSPTPERSLIRFEASCASDGAMAVLAGVDLLVWVTGRPELRVRQISEICLADDGYVPNPLFSTGIEPVTHALVPMSPPSFLGALAAGGHSVLADELMHVGAPTQTQPHRVHESREAESRPMVSPRPIVENYSEPVSTPPILEDMGNAPPPGWELDQMGEDAIAEEFAAVPEPDAAAMAATFGLGPPPRPPSMAGSGLAHMGGEATFADALQRAKEREEKMAFQAKSAEETDSFDE